jgi:uncharacterized protein YndB with AHSA1/START domain
MRTPLPETDTRLRVQRQFAAPRARVFAAFTTPNLICQWLGGTEVRSPHAEIDLRVGGQYRITMQPPNSKPFYIVGIYQEIIVPEKLVYTWSFEGGDVPVQDTLVTIEFLEHGSHTEVILLHERFGAKAVRDAHHDGWYACFDRIEPLL